MSVHEIFEFCKEVVRQGAGAIVAFFLGVVLLAVVLLKIGLWKWPFRRRAGSTELEKQLAATLDENRDLRSARDALDSETRELRATNAKLAVQQDELQAANERLVRTQAELSKELETHKEGEEELARQVVELSEQVQRLADFDGKIWEKPIGPEVPPFRPLARRHVPIIAVTNLKGGVGKTTLTANLGAMFSRTKRVLLVDLDYQGSMTSMCLSAEQIEELRCRKEFVQCIFQSTEPKPDLFVRCCHPVPGQSNLRLLAADEDLADVENRAMARWLLNPENGDVRQILRTYLHDSALTGKFDFILLDCPPRLTTACINALAAADFVLIPVIPDRTSSEAVPRQLRALRKLRQVVCPRLHVLGLIANRTSPREEMIKREKDLWNSLGTLAKDAWEGEVYQFRTVIRQKAAFAEEARDNRFAAFHREVEAMFRDMTTEVEERIIFHERQGSPALSAQS
jgi:cellulose biosynthesis protein BcsQ